VLCGVIKDKNRRAWPAKKEKSMNNLNKVLFATAMAATFSLVDNASAQYRATGADGITASPKVRQQLNERAAATHIAPSTHCATVMHPTHGLGGVAASPKVRQMLAERRVAVAGAPSAEVVAAGYRATGPDDIAASPKLRQRLNERPATIVAVPVK
jgi:hypothetical protein